MLQFLIHWEMKCGKKHFCGKSDVLFPEFFKAMKQTLLFQTTQSGEANLDEANSDEYFALRELFSKKK